MNENTSGELQFVSDNDVIQTIETVDSIQLPAKEYCTDYMVPGSIAANMSTANGTELTNIRNTNEGSSSIGTIGFPFYFFGVDYGTNNTIYLHANQMLLFGSSVGVGEFLYGISLSQSKYKIIELGTEYRKTISAFTFETYTSNNHSIKRFIVNTHSMTSLNYGMEMEIRLIRGLLYQYIEVNIKQTLRQPGLWNIRNNSELLPMFNSTNLEYIYIDSNSIGSFVLRSDLNGNNWEVFKNYYVKICDFGVVDCTCTVERDYKPWEFTNPKCIPDGFSTDNQFRNIIITKKSGINTCTFPKINPNEKASNPSNENSKGELQFVPGNDKIQTIENIGPMFSVKKEYCTDYMVPGNVAANMSTTNGKEITELTKYRGYEDVSIGTIGFPFYCFNIDCGSNGKMFWRTSQTLEFKNMNFLSICFLYFRCGTTITRSAYTFDVYTSNNHSIKRFISSQTSYLESNIFDVNMEIRFIRGIFYQYIEVNMIYNESLFDTAIKDKIENLKWSMVNTNINEYPVFAPKDNPTKNYFSSPPVGSGGSFVLRSDLKGNNWELFKNYYVKL